MRSCALPLLGVLMQRVLLVSRPSGPRKSMARMLKDVDSAHVRMRPC